MKKIIFYLFSFSFLLSCKSITFTKKVEIKAENQNSLESYLNGFGVGTEHLYVMKDLACFKEFTKKMGLRDIFFFNSDGYLVEKRSDKECQISINEIEQVNSFEIKKIEKSYELPDENNVKIDYWLKRIKPMKQNPNEIEVKKDYTVIVSWAKFIGRYNKKSFEWYNELKNSPSYSKINVIFLNLDIQEDWELTQEDKDALGME